MLIFRKMRGDIWRTNILQGAEIIELYLWPKKLRYDGFSGRKPPSSRQVRISGLKQCGALTSSYEGSNSHDKESPKR